MKIRGFLLGRFRTDEIRRKNSYFFAPVTRLFSCRFFSLLDSHPAETATLRRGRLAFSIRIRLLATDSTHPPPWFN
jgi:hypothetical protein